MELVQAITSTITSTFGGHALIWLAILLTIWVAIYRLWFHPLAKYPGPFFAKISGLYILIAAIQCRDTYTRYGLHQKYGKVVRVGPNELCYADINSIKDIYGQSAEPCLKTSFYNGFTLTGAHSVFSTTKRYDHARMRRLLSNGFSERGVLRFQGEIITVIEQFLSILHERSKARSSGETPPVELHDLSHNLFRDIISLLGFGKSFEILASGKQSQGADDIDTYFSICPLFGNFPLGRYLPFGIFKEAYQAQSRIVDFSQSRIDEYRQRIVDDEQRQGSPKDQGQHTSTSPQGLLRNMLEAKDEETGSAFTDQELIENTVIFIVAGSDTTATTLLCVIYELCKRPKMQKRLENEIRDAFPDTSVFPDYEVVTKLVSCSNHSRGSRRVAKHLLQSQTYLNAVVQETLRLRGPIPTTAPRDSPGKIIGDGFIPAGVTVSNLPYSTHRDPGVFADPLTFEPDRWEEPTPEMKLMHRPFSSGPRNCVGLHLARVQLYLTIAALYQRFDVTLDPSTTDEMMIMRDQGLMSPIGKKLWVRLKPRDR